MEKFSCKTKIISGPGAVRALKDLHIRRLFLVADPFFAENGTAARVAALAEAEAVEIYREVRPDPTVEQAAAGTAAVRAFAPDTVAALGGGSAMDCAKAMVFFAGGEIRLVAIPTTSGSGAEVTDFAVLTHDGVKYPLVDRRVRPDTAILDGELLGELPPSLIADAGFDVLCHAVEACGATEGGAVSEALAKDAFRTVFSLLPRSYAGDRSVRQAIHTAAAMAGLAFTHSGLGVCHGIAHALGGAFHVPHGRLGAVLLPAVVAVNAPAAGEKYAGLARAAGLGGSADAIAARNLKNGLVRLRRALDLPEDLPGAGIAPEALREKLPQIVKAAAEDPCCRTNPVPVTEGLVREVLGAVAGHGR